MKKRNELLSESLAGLLSLAMVMASVPAAPVFAEDGEIYEETFIDDSIEEIDDFFEDPADLPEDPEPSDNTFVITEFTDFVRNSDGHFKEKETEEKYGSLSAIPGTPIDQLGLPENLTLTGYWKADGPDVSATYTMTDVDWIPPHNANRIYTVDASEGTYGFQPDFDSYTMLNDDIDQLELDAGLDMLTLDVIIASPEPETVSVPEEDSEPETVSVPDESSEPETVSVPDEGSEPETVSVPDEGSEPETDSDYDTVAVLDEVPASDSTPESDTTSDDENIFDNLDEDLIDAEIEETYSDDPSDTPKDEESPEPAPINEGPSDDVTTDDTPSDNTPIYEVPIDQPASLPDASGYLTLTDSSAVSYRYPTSDTEFITLYAAEGVSNDVQITLPCGSDLDLSTTVITFTTNTDPSATYQSQQIDLTSGTVSGLALTSSDGAAAYQINLGVTKASHTWSADGATCTTDVHCTVCNYIQTPALGHTPDRAEATCTDPVICTRCGEVLEAALGHSKDKESPTCTKAVSCSRCGVVLEPALGHNWVAATCTTPKTCSRCGATEGNALGHDLHDDWDTVAESTETTHGEQERYCHRENCDYYETRLLNIIANPSANKIKGLEEGANYELNTRLTFTAVGAGMGNTDPIDGDVRYVPSTWQIQNTPGTFSDNFSGVFSITKAGNYTLTVTYQKQVYNDGWVNTDIADSKSITFSAGKLIQGTPIDGTSDGVKVNPQTGDSTPIVPLVIAMAAALIILVGVIIYRRKKK